MEIHASCKRDLRTLKAVSKEFGRVKRIVFTAIYLIFVVATGYYAVTRDLMTYKKATAYTAWFVFALVLLIACVALMLTEPQRTYKKLGQRRDAVVEYVFRDDGFDATSTEPGFEASAAVNYDRIEKVIETPEFLFLFEGRNTGSTVDKTTVTGGTVEQLTEKLRAAVPEGKYVVRKS